MKNLKLLTAELLGVDKQTLANWRCTKREDLKYVKIGGRVRYRVSDWELADLEEDLPLCTVFARNRRELTEKDFGWAKQYK